MAIYPPSPLWGHDQNNKLTLRVTYYVIRGRPLNFKGNLLFSPDDFRSYLPKFWLVKPKAADLESLIDSLRRAA